MKWFSRICSITLAAAAVFSLTVSARAADYSFTTTAPQDYYGDTSYEALYGSQYNYGGRNLVDFQVPELEYGLLSSTQTGVMERSLLPGLQQSMANRNAGSNSYASEGSIGYGISDSGGLADIEFPDFLSASNTLTASVLSSSPQTLQGQEPSFTNIDGLIREDGSIGTVKIPSLGISMKVWEGETNESMKKGMGHYSSTSAWDGNVGVCGHNRGSKYVIGSIKNLNGGETITYTTDLGTRTYQVVLVETIDNNDWSYLEATNDNRITLTTCLEDHPEKRICVQALEVL